MIVDIQRQFLILVSAMPRCKNIGGGPGGDNQSSSRLPPQAKGKQEVTTRRKRSRVDRDIDEARAAVKTADRTKRGGRSGGLHIKDPPVCAEATEAKAEEPKPGSQEEQ